MSALNYDNINTTLRNKEDLEVTCTESNKIETINCISKKSEKIDIIVFGNDISISNPRKMGSLYTFFFINGEPFITIGPQCNLILKGS